MDFRDKLIHAAVLRGAQDSQAHRNSQNDLGAWLKKK